MSNLSCFLFCLREIFLKEKEWNETRSYPEIPLSRAFLTRKLNFILHLRKYFIPQKRQKETVSEKKNYDSALWT